MQQGLHCYRWQVETLFLIDGLIWVFSMSGEILGSDIDVVDGYMVCTINVNVDLCFRLSCEISG